MIHEKNMQCPKCKSDLPKGQQTCFVCGHKLKGESEKKDNITTSSGKHFNVSQKNRLIAVLWMILPIAFLLLVLIVYGIVASIGMSGDFARGLNMTLAIFGIIGVLSIIVSIPMAIIFGSRRKEPVSQFDARSGRGEDSVFPSELKKWNWGAAGLPLIWGVYHSVWWCFIVFIPYVNWIWWIIMGLEGNKWAWEKRYWKSVEEFKAAQKKWMPWGIVFLFLPIVLSAFIFIYGIIATMRGSL